MSDTSSTTSSFLLDQQLDDENLFDFDLTPQFDQEIPSTDAAPCYTVLNFAVRTTKYLEKLHAMIENCPSTIIAWIAQGTAFAIYDKDTLEQNILPLYFKPVKFASFVRQLNSYGFRTVKHSITGRSVFEFSHPKFIRGHLDQIRTMGRRRRPKREQGNPNDTLSTVRHLHAWVVRLHRELQATKESVQMLLQRSDIQEEPPSNIGITEDELLL